ncbi:MAG: asparagine synthase (glutamine-hydrolyzing) [Flavobacteriales bacterium]|nr:asparagine synthase (glutamine-hydrolyzing) [Flavobacteriales bacterium]
MCGIAGIMGLEGLTDPRAAVHRMTDAMAHRGPDAEGIWSDRQVVLGHRRLSIIDLSHAADQPFVDHEERFVLVFNGEIYNYRELKAELSPYPFRTNSDTEVLLAAFRKWGAACLERLNGMFAFAVWDTRQEELFIARDRCGIKPLYVHVGDRQVVFASELKAILASGLVPRKLDARSLPEILRYQTVHAPSTIVRDVHMLLPGHWMRLDASEVTTGRWWDPVSCARRDIGNRPVAEIKRTVRDLLRSSVERRLVSDVPFGAFLSGGIDSSAIVGLMAEVSNGPVHTFNVSFDEQEFSEARYAEAIAKRFNTVHTRIDLRPDDLLDYLPEALAAMDHPSADGPNTWVVSKVTKEAGITMALSGTGGDELFAGYEVFKRSLSLWEKRWITQFPLGMRHALGAMLGIFRPGIRTTKAAELLRLPTFSIDDTYPISRSSYSDRQLLDLLERHQLPPDRVRDIMQALIRSKEGYRLPFLTQVSLGELSTYLPNILLRDTDRMSMAHALEVRVPFLDHELVEYVLGIPDDIKYPHTPKQLLVDSLNGLLPRLIVDRPKMGFTLPWSEWMRKDLRSYCEARLNALGDRDQFRGSTVRRLWDRFLASDPRVNWSRLWFLVVLEDWLQRNQIED